MKKLLLSAFSLIAITSYTQNVNIPDPIFKAALIDHGTVITGAGVSNIDIDNDNEISVQEAQNYAGVILCNSLGISDLTGIEAFTSLTNLQVGGNQLTTIDVSQNTQLERLACYTNQLTNLDISQNVNLVYLDCYYNDFTSLDLSSNLSLEYLKCYNNQLTSLDLSLNTALLTLDCDNNNLTTLDVSQNTLLWLLQCRGNQINSLNLGVNSNLIWVYAGGNNLATIDVTQLPILDILNIEDNEFTNIDLTGNIDLTWLDCSQNNITNLDISPLTILNRIDCGENDLSFLNAANGNNINFQLFNALQNSNLNCIKVDDSNFSSANWTDIDSHTNFNENCPVLGIEENNVSLSIYPNPVNDILNIETDNLIEKIEILDLSGKLIATEFYHQINVAQLTSGIYFIKVVTSEGNSLQKFVKD